MNTPQEKKIEFGNQTKSSYALGLSFIVLVSLFAGVWSLSFAEKNDPRSINSSDSTIDSLDSAPDSTAESTSDSIADSTADSKPATATDSLEGNRVVGDTVISKSGLRYIVLEKGDGPIAKRGQVVEVHYTGKVLATNEEFYNSYKRNKPVKFPLGRGFVIEGLDEGVIGMAVGEKRALIIPTALGSWKEGRGDKIPAESELVFEVLLIAIR